jgi:hypothetical protein
MSMPSIENCFSPRNVRRRYCSNSSTRRSRISSRRCSSGIGVASNAPDSITCRSQVRWRCEERCSIW